MTTSLSESSGEVTADNSHPAVSDMRSPLGRADVLSLLFAIAGLIAACIVASSRKPFWNDEILIWVPATDPSIRHMIWAGAHGCVGGNSVVYLLLLRAWMFVAGTSVLSVRLFSCVGICLALAILWVTLRRHLRFHAVAFALLTVWCTSALVLEQVAEGRGYGLYVLAAAFAIAVFDTIASTENPSRRMLVLTALASATLVAVHYFGIFYSGLMLLALLAWDRMSRRFRPPLYAAIMAGWFVLFLRLGAMARDAALLHERSYFRTPELSDLTQFFGFGISYLPILAFTAIIALAVATLRPHETEPAPDSSSASIQPLAILALAWTMLPLLAFVVFRLVPRPVFVDRYMLPSAVGFAVLLAVAASKMLKGARVPSSSRILSLCWITLFALLSVVPVQQAVVSVFRPSVMPTLSKLAPAGIPVVIASQWEFMQANFYARSQPPRYFYVLDRELAMAPDSAIDEPLFFNERTAWKNAGYWADRTLPSEDFLCRFDRFAVLDAPGRLWFSRRVLHNPAFTIESATPIDGRYFALVHRTPGATLPNCRAH